MKKTIIISAIFVLMLSVGVWEIVFSTRSYAYIFDALDELEQGIEANENNISVPRNLEILDDILDRWSKDKEVLFCLGHHSVLRGVDEKLIALDAMIKNNNFDDAIVNLHVCKTALIAIKNDSHPVLSNLM